MAAGLSVCLVWRALCLAVAGGSAELHVLFSGGALGAGGADHRYDDAAENVHVYLDAVHVPENLQILILTSRSHALRFMSLQVLMAMDMSQVRSALSERKVSIRL